MSPSIQQIKSAVRGQWSGILIDAGLPAECLEPGGHHAHFAVVMIDSAPRKMSMIPERCSAETASTIHRRSSQAMVSRPSLD